MRCYRLGAVSRGHFDVIDALIFDFDGVIIDTETPDYLSWQEVFQSYGVELNRGLWTGLIGGSNDTFDVYQHLEHLTGIKANREAIQRRRRVSYLDVIDSSPLLPGVLECILEAKQLGLKLGVASSSTREWVEGHLTRRRLLQHFDSTKGRDDVSRVKPEPDLYLSSVSHLGTRSDNALAIEDSSNGITAAKRAGLYCVAVPNQMTRELPMGHADLRLEALSDMPLESLLAQIGESAQTA